jgi:hypothetical protein
MQYVQGATSIAVNVPTDTLLNGHVCAEPTDIVYFSTLRLVKVVESLTCCIHAENCTPK